MSGLPPGYSSSGDVGLDRRYRWAKASLDGGEAAEACEILRQTVAEAPDWAPAWKLLADALTREGMREEARMAYERVALLDAAGALGAKLDLARLGAIAPKEAMQAGYITALFDEYADRFDAHLTKILLYRGPQAMLLALRDVCAADGREFRFNDVIDLGCGTGLMGEAIRPFVRALSGVDLSAGMLAKARAKLIYDRLAVGDLVKFLSAWPSGAADLILAADVLVYAADLAPVFAAAASALCASGLFAFTVQSCAGEAASEGFVLGADNRFAHSESHIREAAASHAFDVRHFAPVATRQDGGRDVAGFMVVLARMEER
jgi:predicted TPR repeat methyltransferase